MTREERNARNRELYRRSREDPECVERYRQRKREYMREYSRRYRAKKRAD